jgi:replicative DNA helicase
MIDAEAVKREADITAVVEGLGVKLQKSGPGELSGKCPFHAEKNPSFTVTPSAGLWHCFSCSTGGDAISLVRKMEGGSFQDAVKRVAELSGMPIPAQETAPPCISQPNVVVAPRNGKENAPRGPIRAIYPYVDEQGALLYEVCRHEPGANGKAKDFSQRRKHPVDGTWVYGISEGNYRHGRDGWYPAKGEDGEDELPEVRRPLFRLPQVMAADEIFVCEGEKDCLTLEACGLVATTNSGGAAQVWRQEWTDTLRGKRVVILPDQDEPGKKRGEVIARELAGVAAEVITVHVPTGKDVTDWFAAGGNAEALAKLVKLERWKLRQAEVEKRGLISLAEVIANYDGGINTFLNPSLRAPGIQTGYRQFDEMTTGLHGGELIILAGRPSMGKTALATCIAANVCRHGKRVAVFSLEMSKESLYQRIICSEARVDHLRFRHGRCDGEERIQLQKAAYAIGRWDIRIDDAAGTDLAEIERKVEVMQADPGVDLVIVDYLQLMTSQKKENRTQEVSALSRGLKVLARKFSVPFIVLSQLSRAPEQRGNPRPQLSDLRESGGIEQDADLVGFIFREEVYNKDRTDLKGQAVLIISKQRNGPIGDVNLSFLHEYTRFEERTNRSEY